MTVIRVSVEYKRNANRQRDETKGNNRDSLRLRIGCRRDVVAFTFSSGYVLAAAAGKSNESNIVAIQNRKETQQQVGPYTLRVIQYYKDERNIGRYVGLSERLRN